MAKYAERRYVMHREEADPGRLHDAVRSRDLTSLLQLYAEGADLAKPLSLPDGQVDFHAYFFHPYFCLKTHIHLYNVSISYFKKMLLLL